MEQTKTRDFSEAIQKSLRDKVLEAMTQYQKFVEKQRQQSSIKHEAATHYRLSCLYEDGILDIRYDAQAGHYNRGMYERSL